MCWSPRYCAGHSGVALVKTRVLPNPHVVPVEAMLWSRRLDATATALSSREPHDQQDDNRSGDRTENSCRLEVMRLDLVKLDELPEETADERSHDAEQDRAENANGVAARDQYPGDKPGDQPDYDHDNYECEHAYPTTRKLAGHARLSRAGWFGAVSLMR